MSLTYQYILTPSSVTVHVSDGRAFTWHSSHVNFEKIKDALRSKSNVDVIVGLMDPTNTVKEVLYKTTLGLEVSRDGVTYKGQPITLSVVDRILWCIREGFDPINLINFLNKLLENPRRSSVTALYRFLEANEIPIANDGDFIVYKRVRNDYRDIHSGKFNNTPGQVVEMNAWEVDDNNSNTCSNGLHVCSRAYLPHFGCGDGDKVVICKVNPAHVVAVPPDYNDAKMRVHRYAVVGELANDEVAKILDARNEVNPGDDVDGVTWDSEYENARNPEYANEVRNDYLNDANTEDFREGECEECGFPLFKSDYGECSDCGHVQDSEWESDPEKW